MYLDSKINHRPGLLEPRLPQPHKCLLLSTVEQRHKERRLISLYALLGSALGHSPSFRRPWFPTSIVVLVRVKDVSDLDVTGAGYHQLMGEVSMGLGASIPGGPLGQRYPEARLPDPFLGGASEERVMTLFLLLRESMGFN